MRPFSQIWETDGEFLRLRGDCHFLGVWDEASTAPLKGIRASSEAATLTTASKSTLFGRAFKNKVRPRPSKLCLCRRELTAASRTEGLRRPHAAPGRSLSLE